MANFKHSLRSRLGSVITRLAYGKGSWLCLSTWTHNYYLDGEVIHTDDGKFSVIELCVNDIGNNNTELQIKFINGKMYIPEYHKNNIIFTPEEKCP